MKAKTIRNNFNKTIQRASFDSMFFVLNQIVSVVLIVRKIKNMRKSIN